MQIRFTHGHVCNSSSAMTAVASNVYISFTVIPDDYLFLMVHRKLLMNQCPFLIRNINFIFPMNFIVCNLSANTFFREKNSPYARAYGPKFIYFKREFPICVSFSSMKINQICLKFSTQSSKGSYAIHWLLTIIYYSGSVIIIYYSGRRHWKALQKL